MPYDPSDLVLVLYRVRVSLLYLKGVLEVLLGFDGVTVPVDEVESEIPHQPHKRREFLLEFLGFAVGLLQLAGKVCHHVEIVHRVLVNAAH